LSRESGWIWGVDVVGRAEGNTGSDDIARQDRALRGRRPLAARERGDPAANHETGISVVRAVNPKEEYSNARLWEVGQAHGTEEVCEQRRLCAAVEEGAYSARAKS